jgi:hypothetical protein
VFSSLVSYSRSSKSTLSSLSISVLMSINSVLVSVPSYLSPILKQFPISNLLLLEKEVELGISY